MRACSLKSFWNLTMRWLSSFCTLACACRSSTYASTVAGSAFSSSSISCCAARRSLDTSLLTASTPASSSPLKRLTLSSRAAKCIANLTCAV